MPTATSNLERARSYLKAIEQGATGDALARFFDPAVVQEEFPNRLTPNGARRTLPDLLLGAERGQQLLSSQSFEIHKEVENGDNVALEVTWVGTLKVPIQNVPAGANMRALCRFSRISGRSNRRAAQLRLLRSLVGREDAHRGQQRAAPDPHLRGR